MRPLASRRVTLSLVLLMMTAACRGGGGAERTVVTVDELAQLIPGVTRGESTLARELEAANGGRATVPPSVVQGFRRDTGIVHDILTTADESMGNACSAWDNRELVVGLFGGPQAQEYLDRMWSEVDADQSKAEGIDLACKAHEFKEQANQF